MAREMRLIISKTYIINMDKENIDLQKDGISFRSAAVYLSDGEFNEFLLDLKSAFDKIRDYKPSSERRLRKISTITMTGSDD